MSREDSPGTNRPRDAPSRTPGPNQPSSPLHAHDLFEGVEDFDNDNDVYNPNPPPSPPPVSCPIVTGPVGGHDVELAVGFGTYIGAGSIARLLSRKFASTEVDASGQELVVSPGGDRLSRAGTGTDQGSLRGRSRQCSEPLGRMRRVCGGGAGCVRQ